MNLTRPPSSRPLIIALTATLALYLAGCGPTREEIVTSSQTVHAQTFSIADRAAQTIRDQNPDLAFDLNYLARRDDRWHSCSDTPRRSDEPPRAIQWSDTRHLDLTAPRETATLIDRAATVFVSSGWTLGNDAVGNGGRTVYLHNDGYTLSLGGLTEESLPTVAPYLRVSVSSPCIIAPDDVLDWKPGDIPPMPTAPALDPHL